MDYVAWQCDQDAYAATGQKCSAQSILFMHENWGRAGLLEKMKEYASKVRGGSPSRLWPWTSVPKGTQTVVGCSRQADCIAIVPVRRAGLFYRALWLCSGSAQVIEPFPVFTRSSPCRPSRLFSHTRRSSLALRSQRSLSDLTVGPVLTWSTERIMDHVKAVSSLPGARVLFGGKPLEGHSIPKRYGAVEPTAVFVPLETIVKDQAAFDLCTTELFGPFQIVTEVRAVP